MPQKGLAPRYELARYSSVLQAAIGGIASEYLTDASQDKAGQQATKIRLEFLEPFRRDTDLAATIIGVIVAAVGVILATYIGFLSLKTQTSPVTVTKKLLQNVANGSSSVGPSVTSNGISVALSNIALNNDQLEPQLNVSNTTAVRVYLLDVRTDEGQQAILGSGIQVNGPAPSGIPFCNGTNAGVCLGNNIALREFTPVDPGASIPIALQYKATQPLPRSDTLSFSLVLLARFATATDPSDAGAAQALRFNFLQKPFSPK
jgi:hypothetical protein